MFLFKPRQDLVFAAIDESQYIRLFEEGNDFLLCVDENRIYRGTYSISMDTVYLAYKEPSAPDMLPPGKLYINKEVSEIKSIDGNSFSAEIYKDIRERSFTVRADKEWDLVPFLAAQNAKLSIPEGKVQD
jgi:hypothetical protein